MTIRYLRFVAVHVTLLVTLATTGFAQESTAGQSAAHNQVISANPFGWILVPWYNGEYERKVTERATIGLSGSKLPWGDAGGVYSLNMALRYYPSGNAFRGFYLGPRVGMFWVSQEFRTPSGTTTSVRTRIGLGLELGYAWLIGSERHLSVSIGGGATRILNGEPIPVLRLVNIGWAF